ncbi:MAG: DNA polymerase III subunit beta [Fusobacteriia bacterium 4572_132]|nr:MAG: DNA polymerase III subunit beta [Fusobacteriia bacterium 4572_132]
MKIKVDKDNFLKKLVEANTMVSIKTLIPANKYLYIKTMAEKNLLIFRGINSETKSAITVILDKVEISEDTLIGVEGALLEKIISKMPSGELNIAIKDSGKTEKKLIVTNDSLKLEMNTISSEQMPDIEIKDDIVGTLVLEKDILLKEIEKISFAVSKDISRPILNGINFSLVDGKLKLAALDGYRLAITSMDIVKNETEGFDFTVGNNFLKDVVKIFRKIETKTIKLSFNKNKMMLQTKYLRLKTTLLSGEFVNYENIIKTSRDYKDNIKYNSKNMKDSLDRMAIIANRNNNALILKIVDNFIEIGTTSETAVSKEKIKLIEKKENEMKIGVNVNYMMDVLKKVESEKVEMRYKNATSPLFIGEGSTEFLLVPIRLK